MFGACTHVDRLQPPTALQRRSQLRSRCQRPRPRRQPLTAPTAPVEAGVSVQGVDLVTAAADRAYLVAGRSRSRPRRQPLTALQRRSQLRSRCQRPRSRPGDGCSVGSGVPDCRCQRPRSRRQPLTASYSVQGVDLQPTAPVTAPTSAAATSHSAYSAGHSFEAGVSAHGVDLVTAAADRAYLVAGHSVPVRGGNLSQRRSQRPRPQLQPLTAPTAPVSPSCFFPSRPIIRSLMTYRHKPLSPRR